MVIFDGPLYAWPLAPDPPLGGRTSILGYTDDTLQSKSTDASKRSTWLCDRASDCMVHQQSSGEEMLNMVLLSQITDRWLSGSGAPLEDLHNNVRLRMNPLSIKSSSELK